MIYCLVPEALAAELLEPLRAHYGPRADITVIVDRRRRDRRSAGDSCLPAPPARDDGRESPRAATDRRRPVLPRRLAEGLPPAVEPHAASLRWIHRLPPVRRDLEHADLATLLALTRARHEPACSELYWRYASRVAARVSDPADKPGAIEHAMRRVFGHIFDRLHEYDVEHGAFEDFVDAAAGSAAADGAIRTAA